MTAMVSALPKRSKPQASISALPTPKQCRFFFFFFQNSSSRSANRELEASAAIIRTSSLAITNLGWFVQRQSPLPPTQARELPVHQLPKEKPYLAQHERKLPFLPANYPLFQPRR